MKSFKNLFTEIKILQRSVPGGLTALLFVAVVMMNLLANKSIDTGLPWLALDCGILFSWVAFLVMDLTVKHFGLRAANILSVLALCVNLFAALLLFFASLIPGVWSQSGEDPAIAGVLNKAFDATIAGTWFILLGSSIAFIVSALVNNILNFLIGKAVKKDGFGAFILRSYVSTFIGQFVDNLLFALIVSLRFFGWSLLQCVTCALTGAVAELLCEVLFSPVGYAVLKRWEKEGVGKEYFAFLKEREEKA